MDLFDYAMQVEADGKAYYENLATQTSVPGLKTIFTSLAEDEQKHYEIFQQLKASGAVPAMRETTILAHTQNVFAKLPREVTSLSGLEGTLAAYQQAMKVEADSFRFYESAASKENNPATKKLLLKIAEEEHKHFTVLENVYHFVKAPSEYLAWGEFSNLDEFKQFGRDTDS